MKTVIIIPTYNEKGNIGRLIEIIDGTIPPASPHNIQILVVDDSSPDGTADEVKQAQRKFKNVSLLINPKKIGLGSAYLKGMEYAVSKLNADILMEFDADFQHDPKKIIPILDKLNEGYDMVLGSRYIKGGSIPKNWGIHRKFLSFFGNWIIRIIMTNFSVHDWTGGYRAIKKEVYEAVKHELNQERFFGYTFQIGFLHKAIHKGYTVAEVPFHFTDRTRGESKLGPEYIKNILMYIFKARFLEIIHSKFFKFGIVGFIGYVVNAIGLQVFSSLGTAEIVSWGASTEIAIVNNFVLNNKWTFKQTKITGTNQLLKKFLQFNTTSLGALVIQTVAGTLGVKIFGANTRQILLPFIIVFLVLPYNWLMYNRIIWAKTAK